MPPSKTRAVHQDVRRHRPKHTPADTQPLADELNEKPKASDLMQDIKLYCRATQECGWTLSALGPPNCPDCGGELWVRILDGDTLVEDRPYL